MKISEFSLFDMNHCDMVDRNNVKRMGSKSFRPLNESQLSCG